MSNLEFEVLAIDEQGQSPIISTSHLSHSFLSDGQLCPEGSRQGADNSEVIINDNLKIIHQFIEPDSDSPQFSRAFLIKAVGNYDQLQSARKNIVSHLKERNFKPIYILTDNVSEKIACDLYPFLYKVENALRAYILKFMSTRLGPKWWKITATREISKKINQRKNNEKFFSEYIDNDVYLLDYSDLGKMIYEHSSGFTSKQDIIKKIKLCDETPEAIKSLKEELESNYNKFFKKHFQDNSFQELWEKFQYIRHKIAHNNLFTDDDLISGKEIAQKLIDTIKEASEDIPTIEIKEEERNAIRTSLIQTYSIFEEINEEEFLKELLKAETFFADKGGYVSLSHFIQNHLGPLGYDFEHSFRMADKLEALGEVTIEEITPEDKGYPVRIIKSKSSTTNSQEKDDAIES